MLKIFFLICIPALIFSLLEYENISLLASTKMQNIKYYLGSSDNIRNYNEALFLISSNQYSEAKSLLEIIINNKNLQNPADIYELYGDLVYETGGSMSDIIVFYKRSLEYQDSQRVKAKIELLESLSTQKKKEIENFVKTGSAVVSQDTVGTLLRESRRQELMSSGGIQKNIRDLSSGMVAPQDFISRTLDILSTDSTIPKDW